MRHDGMTLAAIAAADGTVSHMTVQRALDNSALTNVKVELPIKTIGKDGKVSADNVQNPIHIPVRYRR